MEDACQQGSNAPVLPLTTASRKSASQRPRPHRLIPIHQQRSLAGRYPLWVKILSLLAFAWALAGWLNDAWFFKFDNSILLNRYTEYGIIVAFGVWRIQAEKNSYTRRRLIILVANVAVLWWLIPWLFPFVEPYMGYLGVLPAFPSLHTPGTLTFFVVLLVVFLFGRRMICGWNCPCVAIREVVGFPFRQQDHVPKGDWAWRLRHVKWLWFVLYLLAMVAMLQPANNTTAGFLGFFAMVVVIPYFLSMLLSPWIGNRGYCRFLCPYGATFGLLNKVGAFRIDYDAKSCTQCDLCEKVCDMGIPVWHLGKEQGRVNSTECMGCGRCVTECPTQSLSFHDARNWFRPSLRQNRDYLLKRAQGGRWRLGVFALILLLTATAAWYYSGMVGSGRELISNLGALCGLPVSTW